MSWARAVVIAVGLFFLAAILLGQTPSYFFTISTLSKLTRLEQGFLDLGLLSIGLGFIALEIALLYDPKPIIPWPLFAALGLGSRRRSEPFSTSRSSPAPGMSTCLTQ